jgi:hypothetical protein
VVLATNDGPPCGHKACEEALAPIMAAVRRELGMVR